jgi:hypothetical protein
MAATRQMTTVVSQAMREKDTGVSCRTPMTAALTPDLAVSYVRELSADVTAVIVLAAGGSHLAGPPRAADAARALLAAAPAAADVAARTDRGLVVAARGVAHTVIAVAGPLGLIGPTALDARAAVEAMDGVGPAPQGAASPEAGSGSEAVRRAADAVISATQSAI